MRPSRQMRRISVLKSPTAAPSKCGTSSINPHPPKANAWLHTSLSAYQRGPSPNSLAWAGPYASGRMPSWPTSTQAEPATHPTEAINGHYRTRQTHRQRLPQPHQLQTPNAPHRRRPRRLHPHPATHTYTLKCEGPKNASTNMCAHLPLQRDLQQFAVGASIAPMCILNAPRFDTTYAYSPPMQAAADDTPRHKHADKPPFSALFQ